MPQLYHVKQQNFVKTFNLFPDFLLEPSLRYRPIALDGRRRDFQNLGGFLNAQTAEVAKLDDPRLLVIEFRKLFQSFVKRD